MSTITENKATTIKKLKTHDFSITNFRKDLSYGKKHEKLVMKSRMDYELKTDRLFVEFESRGKASGISTSKAGVWIFKIVSKGDRHLFSIEIPLSRLKKKVDNNYNVMLGGDNRSSKGYLVPITDLITL